MAYRLGETESTREGLRRCARDELESAIHDLTERLDEDPVEAVHDARKSLKKERSLLRIGRASMPAAQRRGENAALRDAGRRLSVVRDADVMLEALDKIAERYAGQFPLRAVQEIRTRLEHQREAARAKLMRSRAPEAAAEELKAVLERIDDWELRRGGWKAIGPGLKRSYRAGRKAFKTAHARPSMESLHEWRKRCKDLWYHLRLLENVAPHTVHAHAQDAHLLSDLLGDEHDLEVLRASLRSAVGNVAADTAAVVAAIDHRTEQLRQEAFLLGERLYAESPGAFTKRIHRYWKAWRAQAKAEAQRAPAELAAATRAPAKASSDGDTDQAGAGAVPLATQR